MTENEGAVSGGIDYAEAASELRRTLAARLRGRPLPADLVVTTRSEIERREFRAYGQGWRDRGEHEDHRASASGHPPRSSGEATVLPFPPAQQRPPHPAAADAAATPQEPAA
ncbi:hypothetical protein G3I35_32665, partial [Streptomyces sp. SID10815]|nr:hypothetical protein [Streptomyces sp. SID10815]